MSGKPRARYQWKRKRLPINYGKTCQECRKYSRKTFYCAKWMKVLDQNREACMYFRFRRRSGRQRRKKK